MIALVFALAYVGDVAIVASYVYLARTDNARPFHWANALGCVPIIFTELVLHAYPPLILTAVFGAVGFAGLARAKRSKDARS